MIDKIKEFRDGIFALRTRRFGTVAELMIEVLFNYHQSHNQFRDRYDSATDSRVEIKFSTFQHKGNKGEGQFHLNQGSIDWHLENKLVQWLDYDELYSLFSAQS